LGSVCDLATKVTRVALKNARASDLPSILHLDTPAFPLSNAKRNMRSVAAS